MKKNLYIGLVVLGILCVLCNYSADKKFFSKTVNYNGDNLLVSIDGFSSNIIPTSGNYYLASYKCSNSKTVVTWDRVKYKLSVLNDSVKSNVACRVKFESKPRLVDISKKGDYVSYVGNNGSKGFNSNYVNDNDKGYSFSSDYKYYVNGFRVAYNENDTSYIVTAGSPENVVTDNYNHVIRNAREMAKSGLAKDNLESHVDNLNSAAFDYCNSMYVYKGKCIKNENVWAFNINDIGKIVGQDVSNYEDFSLKRNMRYGYANDLIDNGSYYYVATKVRLSGVDYIGCWDAKGRYFGGQNTQYNYGVRPVIRLDSNVRVSDGDGSYANPYKLVIE